MAEAQGVDQGLRQPRYRSRRKAPKVIIPETESSEEDADERDARIHSNKTGPHDDRNGLQTGKSSKSGKRRVKSSRKGTVDKDTARENNNDDDDDDDDDVVLGQEEENIADCGWFLNALSCVIGITLAFILGYAYYLYVDTLHENRLWFSSIMVSFWNVYMFSLLLNTALIHFSRE